VQLQIAELVSEPLKQVLINKPHELTDSLFFYDDSWAKYKKKSDLIVGGGHVQLEYFVKNPQPDGVLERSMVVKPVGNRDHRSMVRTLVDMVIRDSEAYDHDKIVAFVVCSGFPDKHIDSVLKHMGYNRSDLPPIVHALKKPITLRKSGGRIIGEAEPRDYLYKQQVGDYAHFIHYQRLCSSKR
jgi:hypothetical protein